MSRLRLHPDDRIILGRTELRFVESKTHTVTFRLVGDPSLTVTHTHADLVQAQVSGDWLHDPGYHAPGRAEAREESGVEGLSDLEVKELDRIDFKLIVCRRLDDLIAARDHMREGRRRFDPTQPDSPMLGVSLSDDGITAALDIMWDDVEAEMAKARDRRVIGGTPEPLQRIKRPCVQSVRDWYNRLVSADWEPSALRNKYFNCGRREPRFSSVVHRLLRATAALYASETRPTRRHLHDLLRVAVDDLNRALPPDVDDVPVPSLAALNRRIDALEPFATYAARHGIKKAKHKFRILTGGVQTLMPGERIEMDEHQLHIQADMTEAGYWHLLPEEDQKSLATCRLWVCAALDCATDCELGLAWGLTPSTAVALECLRQVMSDKAHIAAAVGSNTGWPMMCRPLQVVTDNGSSFTGAGFRTACAGLRIRHIRTVAGEAWMRGKRERAFRSRGQSLLGDFAGQTFANVVDKGDYPSQARVSVTGRNIITAFVRNVLCVHHNRPSAGLGGETPGDAWDRLTAEYGVSPVPGRDTIRAVFGTGVTRVVGPHGVRVLGLNYQSRQLQAWHRSTLHADKIDVRVDHHDVGRVSVRVGKDWIHAECVTPHMDGVSLATLRETRAALAVRFAAGAKIREKDLLEGIRAGRAMAREGLGIFGLSEDWSTPDAIARAERDLDMGWIMPGDEEGHVDPLSRAVPSTGPEVAWPAPASTDGPLFRESDGGVDDPPQVHDPDAESRPTRQTARAPAPTTETDPDEDDTWIDD